MYARAHSAFTQVGLKNLNLQEMRSYFDYSTHTTREILSLPNTSLVFYLFIQLCIDFFESGKMHF